MYTYICLSVYLVAYLSICIYIYIYLYTYIHMYRYRHMYRWSPPPAPQQKTTLLSLGSTGCFHIKAVHDSDMLKTPTIPTKSGLSSRAHTNCAAICLGLDMPINLWPNFGPRLTTICLLDKIGMLETVILTSLLVHYYKNSCFQRSIFS